MVNEEKRESWKFVFMEVADVVLDPIKFVAIKLSKSIITSKWDFGFLTILIFYKQMQAFLEEEIFPYFSLPDKCLNLKL